MQGKARKGNAKEVKARQMDKARQIGKESNVRHIGKARQGKARNKGKARQNKGKAHI
jgi:hypothetical protein